MILSKPTWMFGAEMGSNDAGVCIGNEAVWSNYKSDESLNKRLLGMDLVRLGLERSSSAKDALDVMTSLLEKYGQGGPCSQTDETFSYFNSFIIADPKEAFVLETVDRLWAAERITSGHRNISNSYSIGTKIDLMSSNLLDEAKSAGLWDGNGKFDFSKAFGTGQEERFVIGKKLLDQLTEGSSFSETDMMKILRDEKSRICRSCDDEFPTAASQVSVLSPSDKKRPHLHFMTGTPDANYSVFKPFIFCSNVKFTHLTTSPDDDSSDRRHLLYKLHEYMYPIMRSDSDEGKKVKSSLDHLESVGIKEINQLLDSNAFDDDQDDLGSLFSDAVEAEIRFYK